MLLNLCGSAIFVHEMNAQLAGVARTIYNGGKALASALRLNIKPVKLHSEDASPVEIVKTARIAMYTVFLSTKNRGNTEIVAHIFFFPTESHEGTVYPSKGRRLSAICEVVTQVHAAKSAAMVPASKGRRSSLLGRNKAFVSRAV